jgi:dUTP pyrophosphatase
MTQRCAGTLWRLDHYPKDKPLPERQTAGSIGMDILSAEPGDVELKPGERKLFRTGFRLHLASGWEAQIRPRSGLAHKHGVTVLNAPGTIDQDYRDEVQVLLINFGQEPVVLQVASRIAQLVFCPLPLATYVVGSTDVVVIGEEPETYSIIKRPRAGGFGSTGDSS